MPADILIKVPIYRMDGYLDFSEETPSGVAIAYHVDVAHIKWQAVTPAIDAALESHKQTIQDLLLAGL